MPSILLSLPVRLTTTVGVHPCTALEFERRPDYLQTLRQLLHSKHVVAVGECGLDYDRLEHCDADRQRKYFAPQFELAAASGLPMFLHLRACAEDFVRIVRENRGRFGTAVVHSFTDTAETAMALIEMGLYIGVNGCSLKTEENVEVVRQLPIDRIMIESDAPWCELRQSHAGTRFIKASLQRPASVDKSKHTPECQVKGRNEPCSTRLVLEAIAAIKGVPADELADQIYANTTRVFRHKD